VTARAGPGSTSGPRRDDLVVALAGAAGLYATARLAASGEVGTPERVAFEQVNRLPNDAAPALWVVMQGGSFAAVFVAGGFALALRRPRLAVALVAGGTATWLLAKAVKRVVKRGRPVVLFSDVVLYGPAATGLGFPSGHAAVAALLITTASPYLNRPGRVVGWTATAVIALTRIFVGAHLPLDAAGGLLLGVTTGRAVRLLLPPPRK